VLFFLFFFWLCKEKIDVRWLFFLFLPSLAFGEPLAAVVSPGLLSRASQHARSDGVGGGWCGRGLWSVLTEIGFSEGIRSANGQDWEEVLSSAGWVPMVCSDPSKAPLGSVLVYLSDIRLKGKNLVGTKGGIYGHAELVGVEKGDRVYISDAPRARPGGTVPHNFTQRAWLPPGTAVASVFSSDHKPLRRSYIDPAKLRRSAEGLLSDRLAVARYFFSL
jgi:hypothetical protein